MINKLAVTILVDNHSDDPRLCTEHGLSLWIEADNRRIIFDAGQSDLLTQNAETLAIDLREADTLVLSHGHYDHTGGVAKLIEINPSLELYGHPGIFDPRYSRQGDGSMKPVGMTKIVREALHHSAGNIRFVSRAINLTPDIGITGPIPRRMAFEDTGGAFFLDPEAHESDPIDDDGAMWFITTEGVTVITGCCHSGLVNTLAYIRSIAGNLPIVAIIGGFHLLNASVERIEETCHYLKSAGIGRIVPCHCTGERAVDYLEKRFGTSVVRKGRIGRID